MNRAKFVEENLWENTHSSSSYFYKLQIVMYSDKIDILMILASENILQNLDTKHYSLLEMPGGCGVPDGGGCLYQLRFGSPRSALDFRGNMSEKSIRSILLYSTVYYCLCEKGK